MSRVMIQSLAVLAGSLWSVHFDSDAHDKAGAEGTGDPLAHSGGA